MEDDRAVEDQPEAEVEAHHDVDQPDDDETDQARPGLTQEGGALVSLSL